MRVVDEEGSGRLWIKGSLVQDSLEALHYVIEQSKKEDKDQESIQSNTTPDPGHPMGMRQKKNTR